MDRLTLIYREEKCEQLFLFFLTPQAAAGSQGHAEMLPGCLADLSLRTYQPHRREIIKRNYKTPWSRRRQKHAG